MEAPSESSPSKPGKWDYLDERDPDTICGIGRFKPKWLQVFATPTVYLLNYCILGILQGAYFTYTVGVISTIEKRFSFESKISGIILIADNLSAMLLSIVIGYYGRKSHRPRLIFVGMLVVVLSCFLSSLPYFIFGPGSHLISKSVDSLKKPQFEICDMNDKEAGCDEDYMSSSSYAIGLLFLGNFLNGFGYTAFYTIGTPYLDDNIDKKNTALYFGVMFALRMFGPSLGFLISSLTLKFYEDPYFVPEFSTSDPRWIGAWWMGFIIIGVGLLIFTIPIILFPRALPSSKNVDSTAKKQDMPKLKDMPKALMKLLKNPIYICHTLSITLQVNGYAGYYVFMPKYLESQYRQSASSASLFSGSTTLITMIIGVLLGGGAIHRFKPRAKYLMGYILFIEIFTCLGFLLYMFLGCPPVTFSGMNTKADYNLENTCNVDCQCTKRIFTPICAPDNETVFFSPCFAGCQEAFTNTSSPTFGSCSCSGFGPEEELTKGYCPENCNMFLPYIIIMSLIKMVSSTGRVGSTMVTFRSVDENEKDFAVGVMLSFLDIFAFIPYPLVFGAMTDSACLIWEEKCGKTGNCWFYDSDKFRYYLHGLALAFIVAGTCFEVVVFFMSDRLKNLYADENKDKDEIQKDIKLAEKLSFKRLSIEQSSTTL